jgi:hypothetical protein
MKWKMGQAIIQHPTIKPAGVEVAMRLLDHLNTSSKQCNPSYSTLAVATGLNRDTVITSVAALEAAGFLSVCRALEPGEPARKGQALPSNSFTFNFDRLSQSEKPTIGRRKILPPRSEKPTTPVGNIGHTQSEFSGTGSRKSRPKTEKEETEKEETGKGSLIADDQFDRFWTQYPKRVDKASARKAFDRAMKRASFETIIAGVHRYAAERTDEDPKFTKHPATWLNADAWLNDAQPRHRPKRSVFQQSMQEGLLGDLTPEDFISRG